MGLIDAKDLSKFPRREQYVLHSWLFMWAFVFLGLAFASLQLFLSEMKNKTPPSYIGMLHGWFFIVSNTLLVAAVTSLLVWHMQTDRNWLVVFSTVLKLIGSVFLCFEPATSLVNDPSTGGPEGLWWSNLVGVTFFHLGNVGVSIDWLIRGSCPSLGCIGAWSKQAGTLALFTGTLLSCNWGDAKPSAQWVDTNTDLVAFLQFFGTAGLLVGSLIYIQWCGGFTSCCLGSCTGDDCKDPEKGGDKPELGRADCQ